MIVKSMEFAKKKKYKLKVNIYKLKLKQQNGSSY